jgi:hypothetical protein
MGILCLLPCGVLVAAAGPGPAAISNEILTVQWDPTAGCITLARQPEGGEFLRVRPGGPAVVGVEHTEVQDADLGRGQALELRQAGGGRFRLELYPGHAFVFGRVTYPSSMFEDGWLRRWELWEGTVSVATDPGAWRVLGTGGLASPDRSAGSYVWLAVARPQSRSGLVLGWITQDRGSGVWFPSQTTSGIQVRARLDYGRVQLDPGVEVRSETWAAGWFEDARLGLEQWADLVALRYRIRLPSQPSGYCTWYSRPHGGASDEVHLKQLAELAARELAPFGFQVVQIDDRWQAGFSTNGPRRNFTTHDPRGPYPSGMKAAADHLRSLGLVPGLWFMPFAGTWYDPWFAPHQDWFVRREDGSPYETVWGGTCLDLTHPGARDHVEAVTRRIVHEWGFRYLKLDGLWTGSATRQQYINSGYKEDFMGDARFHDPRRSNLEVLRDGLKLVRAAAGPDVFLLGCNAAQNMRAYAAAIGCVDAMRVGPDNGPEWDRLIRGPLFSSRQYFLNGRVWYNDPDPVYVRSAVPLEQARLICSWVNLSGNLWMNSDWLPDLPPERLDILKRTLPPHGHLARPVDLFEREPARIWVVRENPVGTGRVVVGLFNWDAEPWKADVPLAGLGLDPTRPWETYEFWEDRPGGRVQTRLQWEVPARACRVLMFRPAADHPQVLSTSRHVTQGLVDVQGETWEENSRSLSGWSAIVGGDPYELRIVLPEATSFTDLPRVEIVLVTASGETFPVTPEPVRREGRLLRVRWRPDQGGTVRWRVQWP